MTTVKLSRKNQVVVPKESRETLGVKPGDQLVMVPRGRAVIVVCKTDDVLASLKGSAKGVYGGPEKHLQKERKSWDREKS